MNNLYKIIIPSICVGSFYAYTKRKFNQNVINKK